MKQLSEHGEESFGVFVAAIILWFLSLALQGQEIENLGLVTHRRGIILEHSDTNRTDFVHFVLEIKQPWNETNITATLIRTNDFLNLDDFGMVLGGSVLMGVKSIYSDGDESPVALFRLEIRRTRLMKSKARGIAIAGTNHATLHELLQTRKAARTNSVGAPMPSFDTGSGRSLNVSAGIPFVDNRPMSTPMRGGSNESYSEHIAKMKEYFGRPNRK